MERSEFLRKSVGFFGMALIAPSLLATKKQDVDKTASCTVANSETAGPFPTITPASLLRSNIVDDRTGVALTVNINVKNINNGCNPLPTVIVDIWHCDKDGNYSEYGGTSMQTTDYTAYNFLRGRQVSDSNGLVTFTSIFPGWYQSRATHIHVHIYTSSGTSLLISQIAFPEGSTSEVVTVNNATTYGYTKGMTGYTYNSSDNVFSDGTSTEMCTLSGSISGGYVLNWDAYVSAPAATSIHELSTESQFQIRQNFPNPCINSTKIPIVLNQLSEIKVTILSIDGRELNTQNYGNLNAGEQILDLDVSDYAAGRYVYSVKISNASGSYKQSRIFMKE